MFKRLIIIILATAVAIPALALEKAAEVTASKGRVEIVHGDAVMGKRAEKGSELIFKDILRTKRRGYAEVGFIDGTNVKVFEKSRLTINGLERLTDGYNAEIQKGKVLFNVEKMEDVAGDFSVKTTNSIIGVKGTTFGVVSGGLVTIVEVYNGNVEVLATVSRGDFEAGKVDVGAIEGTGKGGDAVANKGTVVANLSSGQGMVLSSSGDVQVYEFSNDGDSKSLIFEGEVATGEDKSEGESADEGGEDGDDGKTDDSGDDDSTADDGTADEGTADEGTADEGTADDGGADDGAADEGAAGNVAAGGADSSGDDGAGGVGDGGGDADNAAFASIGLVEESNAGGGDEGLDLFGGVGLGDTGGAGEGADTGGDLGGALADMGIPSGNNDTASGGVPDVPGAQADDTPDVGDVSDDLADTVSDAEDFYTDPDVKPDTEEQIDYATGIVNINIKFK